MDINRAKAYLEKNEKKVFAGGKSGAKVYDIEGKYVLKQIYRAELGNDELYEAYRKEAWWYANGGSGLGCLPEVLDLRSTEEEISILMKRYRMLSRREIKTELLEKIMRSLASVHVSEIPLFLRQKQHAAQPLSEEQIRTCVEGWHAVLDEHPGVFDGALLECIAERINPIISWHSSEETVLSHGDFHWDNLLMDNEGRILICDWQGVEAGTASGDLSFFFGRLRGDGIQLKEQEVVESYGREIRRLSGKRVTWEEMDGHIRAANVITSFTCWHAYLHGSGEERVREIYEKMVTDSHSI
ncbi:MAG: phosphotransferase [Lachnospiraceae bacterium]|jgi:aminoglycoside phosphotransferase (APT) family kinase protein|nr:phosphotransferase [Lachnospiraceae bacterium]